MLRCSTKSCPTCARSARRGNRARLMSRARRQRGACSLTDHASLRIMLEANLNRLHRQPRRTRCDDRIRRSRLSSCSYMAILISMRSGPCSWARSAPMTASAISAVKRKFLRSAPSASPRSVSSVDASSMYARTTASAFSAMALAVTRSPSAKNNVAQLAPMTPVPTKANCLMRLPIVDSSTGERHATL